jgi:ABC-type multidrug transport system ATPase subunit
MPTLEAHGLAKSFADRRVLVDVGLVLYEGERVLLSGRSGSGKTTLLRLLAWLEVPDTGEVLFDGRTPRELGPTRWRTQIAYVPQRAPRYPGTPMELVRRIQSFESRSAITLDPRHIGGRWHLRRDAWDQPWSSLSVGEQQRAQLAIALACDPAVLLLDEPTSSLDEQSTNAVMVDLLTRTAIWVTHDPGQAHQVATRTIDLWST